MPNIKVLRVITRLNIGGPSINAILLTEGLNTDGFQTALATGSTDKDEGDMFYFAKDRGVDFTCIPQLGRRIDIINDFKAFIRIYGIIKKYRPDVVHTHMAKAGALGRIAAKMAGVPVVVHTFHGHVFEGYFDSLTTKVFIAIERVLGRFTTKVVAVSNSVENEVSLRYNIVPKDKVAVVPLGFDLDRFLRADKDKGKLKKELGLADDILLVGIVGRLVPIKNHRMFLDAVRILRASSPLEVKFLIAGDGQLRRELQDYAARSGVKDDCIFLGWRRDLENIYASLDIACLTSLNEGTPVSLIEAMASGLPVIATDVGGVRDIVTDGSNGLLVESNNADAFSKALVALLTDGQKRCQMGLRGRDFAAKNFRKERLISDMKSLYERLILQKRGLP
jgi:glycosyltransferase involved in cell wall biosynthesis